MVGAGDGNRTHVTSLEGWGSTIELHPRNSEFPRFRPPVAIAELLGGGSWIRTNVGIANGFTARPL